MICRNYRRFSAREPTLGADCPDFSRSLTEVFKGDSNRIACNYFPVSHSRESAIEDVGAVTGERLFHLIQLPLHNIKLPSKNEGTYDAGEGYSSSQENHPSIASINTINESLVSCGLLSCSLSSMILGYARLFRRQYWLGTLLCGGAIFFAFHGIALIFG